MDTFSLPTPEACPPSMTVRAGRDAYLAENGFTVDAYDAKWIDVSFLGVSIPTPNTRRRGDAIKLHDLHHVVTGFGTDVAGEAEISAWEVRRGLGGLGLYVTVIVIGVALLGLLGIAPRRTVRAWRTSRGGAGSLFRSQRDYASLLAMSVGELRRELGLPEEGLATSRRGLHSRAPSVLRPRG
jgi:hypothetical protein